MSRSWNEKHSSLSQLFADRADLGFAYNLFNYQKGGITQRMLRKLKYDGSKEVGIGLGEMFGKYLKDAGVEIMADGFVAVPLHPAKIARRGYNQSDLIVQGLREQFDIPDLSPIIKRTTYTESQTSRGRFERFENMDHVFQCPDPSKVSGLNLIIVDDVVTTGSTMKACMNVLSKARAAQLNVLTLAIA